ncbi:hypothetical protein KUTeg_024413 [Tegillarca granosa]|uniref:Bicarbonate transporter-like transmembrane domain-containing protein n=1 Tax=Tegillarca granosa TaxID=220873 RepID=A0ABQ9E2S1_TEGGR|nr:hypothetical protein KUTeg_024413 [Tegillarca granosa]
MEDMGCVTDILYSDIENVFMTSDFLKIEETNKIECCFHGLSPETDNLFHSKGMDLPPLKDEKGGVELQQVTVVTIDNDSSAQNENPELTINQDSGPPPYKEQNGLYSLSNGSVPSTPTFTPSNRISPPSSPFGNNMTFDGDVSGLSPRTGRSNTLSVDSAHSARRRHKSEGQLPGSPGKPMYLDPNRKSSTYESRSTISGIKFDDSYIVPLKDFSMEVRAHMDIDKFLNNTVLILDLNKVSLDEIIDEILHKLLDSTESKVSFDQARSALFTHDCVHQLSRTLQCTSISEGGGFDYDQNWICAMASIPSISTRHVGIARLHTPANLGTSSQEVYFVIVVLTPTKEKGTKNELETARTFATIFSDLDFRLHLLGADSEEEFKEVLQQHANELAERQKMATEKVPNHEENNNDKQSKCRCRLFNGIICDLKRRLPHYISDYKDGLFGPKSIQKTISTTLFLYFACLMPSIAFGVLNSENTKGVLDVEKVLYSQTFGGLLFAIIGGTPQIVLLTTAPLALYTKIIHSISYDFGLDFKSMYAMVGLWNSFFLFIYSAFDLSVLMQWSTRSSEEIFALFIAIAFSIDALKSTVKNFESNYDIPACKVSSASVVTNTSINSDSIQHSILNMTAVPIGDNITNITDSVDNSVSAVCGRDISLLYLVLLLGTVWLGVTLYNFTTTVIYLNSVIFSRPYLNAGKRELLADYSLPVAVVVMTFFGAFVFKDVSIGKSFEAGERDFGIFQIIKFYTLPLGAIFGAMGLGFCLSLLMKKGTSYHWDLLVVGIINAVLSLICFPMVHAALPHSPLHVRALADVEERVDQGHINQIIVRVRETRLTGILSHILIGVSLFILDILAYIPTPVLYGLFLYVAATSVYGNQLFERITLLITEQSAYPPNHYIRRVPQRKMHMFTLLQLLQLVVLCGFGFSPYPYLKVHKLIPKVIEQKYLKAMDGH